MDFEIITKENSATLHFFTQAKTVRGALRKLINNSHDFKNIKEQKNITIKIKQCK